MRMPFQIRSEENVNASGQTVCSSKVPVGVLFMEPVPDGRTPGRYDEKMHQWVNDQGVPVLLASATTTASNGSTGPRDETDLNEDYD